MFQSNILKISNLVNKQNLMNDLVAIWQSYGFLANLQHFYNGEKIKPMNKVKIILHKK